MAARPLNATTYDAGERAPVRIVHLGLGAFHRAHQARYTQLAGGNKWGIAAFTGRSAAAADELAEQDGLFTLVERGAEGDTFAVVDSIVEAHDGADLHALASLLALPSTAMVTLTVTEAGYKLAPGGGKPRLDIADAAVAADAAALSAHYSDGLLELADPDAAGSLTGRQVTTAPGRLVAGLAVRRAADGWPLAVVSCDNLAGNGAAARASVVGMAELVDAQLAAWIAENVSFVDTSIDRITPRTTDADRAAVAEGTGYSDASPVVTEPFSSWVLSGEFPAGRPDWQEAGAVFVDDLEPFERRKLWLLNGAHSLMAYAGQLRGHATVAEALVDPAVAGWVDAFWDAAAAHLTDPVLDIPGYRAALLDRFGNPRIAHHLAQIAMDGSVKLAMRAVPVYRAEREAGRDGEAALRLLAAWADQMAAQAAAGVEISDPAAAELASVLADSAGDATAQTAALLRVVDTALGDDAEAVAGVVRQRGTIAG